MPLRLCLHAPLFVPHNELKLTIHFKLFRLPGCPNTERVPRPHRGSFVFLPHHPRWCYLPTPVSPFSPSLEPLPCATARYMTHIYTMQNTGYKPLPPENDVPSCSYPPPICTLPATHTIMTCVHTIPHNLERFSDHCPQICIPVGGHFALCVADHVFACQCEAKLTPPNPQLSGNHQILGQTSQYVG